MRIDVVDPDQDVLEDALAQVLVDCVHGGASVGFLAPLPVADAARWWQGALRAPGTVTLVARDDDGRVDGVVQLRLVPYPNGLHRAELAKLLVHRRARGRGVAAALLDRAEQEALARGRWLLVLDTRTGSPAEGMYARRGWQRLGSVPDYALDPDGGLAPTTFMTRRLPRGRAVS